MTIWLETIQLIGDIFRNSIFQYQWLFELQAQFSRFPAKTLLIEMGSDVPYFLHIENKFLKDMMSFERPTSIIAFGEKSSQLHLKFKKPLML